MTDLARLQEALIVLGTSTSVAMTPKPTHRALQDVMDAARLVVDGQDVWWCAENKKTTDKPCVVWRAVHSNCGPARLVFPKAGT